MADPNFKQPREADPDYLAWIRTQPCCLCGDDVSVEAHHPRVAVLNVGGATKASDKWALPLCGRHHRELHAYGNEAAFWASFGVDPLAKAMQYRKPT